MLYQAELLSRGLRTDIILGKNVSNLMKLLEENEHLVLVNKTNMSKDEEYKIKFFKPLFLIAKDQEEGALDDTVLQMFSLNFPTVL